jgi:hypothetical protein
MKNNKILSVNISKEKADKFMQICQENGTNLNAALKGFIESVIDGDYVIKNVGVEIRKKVNKK